MKGRFQSIKVVVLTSELSTVVAERCQALCADAVLDKADAVADLLSTLRLLRDDAPL